MQYNEGNVVFLPVVQFLFVMGGSVFFKFKTMINIFGVNIAILIFIKKECW